VLHFIQIHCCCEIYIYIDHDENAPQHAHAKKSLSPSKKVQNKDNVKKPVVTKTSKKEKAVVVKKSEKKDTKPAASPKKAKHIPLASNLPGVHMRSSKHEAQKAIAKQVHGDNIEETIVSP
jgi:hypothetical protein